MPDVAAKSVVLVVEDDPLLRLFAIDMVEDAGFEVVQAANSAEAVKLLEERADIRIVFSDIDMPPGLNGLQLATRIRDRWPPIEIILTSGKPFPLSGQLPDRGVFYSKPYRQEQIIETLHRFAD